MSTADDGLYTCPECGKPFDRLDGLFDFAIAPHEKSHKAQYRNPANLIRYDQAGLMWHCKICGDPLHAAEFTAQMQAISHCNEKHGGLPASTAPVTARGGRGKGSGSRSLADVVGDIAEDVGEAIGKAFDAIGDIFGD